MGREAELPHEVDSNYDINDYKCVGWVVLPMKVDPCDLMMTYDIKNKGFGMPTDIAKMLFSAGDESGLIGTASDLVFNSISKIAGAVMLEHLRCEKNESAGYYKAYLVLLKKKKFLCWEWLGDNPVFLEVQGGNGWEEAMEGYHPKEKAEAAAKMAAEEWDYYGGDAYDMEEAMKEPEKAG